MIERKSINFRERSSIASEISPTQGVVEALKGTVSESIKTISQKPGQKGKEVVVRIVKDGPGLFGLTGMEDNKEWSGIFNHTILSARYSVYFAEKMLKADYETHPQTILDAMIVSHAGRRVWDEASWYPQAVPDADEKRRVTNETLGLRLIKGKVPAKAFELVAALAHNPKGVDIDPAIYNSWDYKITSYVDHRTAQEYGYLHIRMGVFLINNFFDRKKVTDEVKEEVYGEVKKIIERRRDLKLGKDVKPISLEEADEIAKNLGANLDSPRLKRKDLMGLILRDAETEAVLIKSGINPDAVNDITVPMPNWEDDLRKKYLETAKEEIIKRINELDGQPERLNFAVLNEFSPNTWWDKYARELYNKKMINK